MLGTQPLKGLADHDTSAVVDDPVAYAPHQRIGHNPGCSIRESAFHSHEKTGCIHLDAAASGDLPRKLAGKAHAACGKLKRILSDIVQREFLDRFATAARFHSRLP